MTRLTPISTAKTVVATIAASSSSSMIGMPTTSRKVIVAARITQEGCRLAAWKIEANRSPPGYTKRIFGISGIAAIVAVAAPWGSCQAVNAPSRRVDLSVGGTSG